MPRDRGCEGQERFRLERCLRSERQPLQKSVTDEADTQGRMYVVVIIQQPVKYLAKELVRKLIHTDGQDQRQSCCLVVFIEPASKINVKIT